MAVIGTNFANPDAPKHFLYVVDRLHKPLEVIPSIRDDDLRIAPTCVEYSPHGRFLAWGGGNQRGDGSWVGIIAARDGKSYETLFEIDLDVAITTMRFSHEGRFLVTGDRSGNIRLWDAQRRPWKVCNEIEAHKSRVSGLTFTRDGKMLISGSSDGTMGIWSLGTAPMQ